MTARLVPTSAAVMPAAVERIDAMVMLGRRTATSNYDVPFGLHAQRM